MYKRSVGLALALFSAQILWAQFSISGTIKDGTAKTVLAGATVRLFSSKDSTFRKTMLSDSVGRFNFSELSADSFLLSVSFIGYKDLNQTIQFNSSSSLSDSSRALRNVSVDVALVPGSSKDMATVIISTSISPTTQKGDTLEINASSYKVNPDATTEDLVKKMPGITIENGQVKAQGENVQKVTIDGRELFGDDATAALRNLPAEVVDKIQVFDRLSDQAQFSGIDDGNTTKGINIVTKANMRNGQFGRVFAGYGTDDRYAAGGNSTILKENRRISLVGNFNNINQQNFSQQDLLGVTSTGGGGGNRGGRPQGGGGGGGRPQGGGGGQFGGFGNNSNFLVGQQAGINKTNAAGLNYSDILGKKVTLTGSYFFNHTNNTTNQISNLQYLSPASSIDRVSDTTESNSINTNHRVNVRFEWRIDSNNQLTVTPNLSFQSNNSYRRTESDYIYFPSKRDSLLRAINQNISNSNRSGNNLNTSIFYRHAFSKRGRTFSIGLNSSSNKRTGGTYVNTYTQTFFNPGYDDTTTNRFTDQHSDGLQLSANLAYTEPLSLKSQLQFNYNPSVSKSTANQQAYLQNPMDNKYSVFIDRLSNVFENRTDAHNAGLTYRYFDRDRQVSFGVNYQYTGLNSERIFPINAKVDKSFSNILPNAQIRYKVSARSSFRINYRTNVNQPSVTQLQDVLDITNPPSYSVGNPDLNQQYTQSLNTQYTYTNTGKSLLLVGNIFYQAASNYIASASFNSGKDTVVNGEQLKPGYRLTKPVNLDGYNNFRSFVTFAIPLKIIKSNLNVNGGVSLTTLPGMINYISNKTKSTTYTLGTVIGSNVSQYIDFTFSYSANFNNVTSNVENNIPSSYFQHIAGLQVNLLAKSGWFFQNDLNNQYYNGLTAGLNQNYFLWNMSIGKKFLKGQKGELKLSVFDLLKQNRSIVRTVTAEGIEDVQNQVLQQYFMLTFSYNLRNFGTAAARSFNRGEGRNFGGGDRGEPRF